MLKARTAVNIIHQRLKSHSAIQKWAYNLSGFNKYGLMRDDLLYEDSDVKEALRRLPQDLIDERNYRILRATQLSITKTILPKPDWMQLEKDVLYLTPYVNDVIKEREEREEWNKSH